MQLEQLRASLKVLEDQRALLGPAIDPALEAVRTQIAALETQLTTPAQTEERRIVTVLFSDIVGSTTHAEGMDSEDWRTVVNVVHTIAGQAIQKYGGVVMQYQGDGVVAIFGIPAPHEQDPENAIRAGLEMQANLAQARTQPRIQMRVGIHTGLVLLGSIGSHVKQEYSGFGDPMNLAARLQAAAPTGGVLISHDTYRYVRGVFDLTQQPPIMVKGKSLPIQTYVVHSARPRPFRTVNRGVVGVEVQTIGREAELQQIVSAFEAMCRDHTVTWVQLIGEPGMGKSRLLSDARDALDLRPERFRWLRARAFQGDEKHAFMLVRRMWFDRFEVAEDAPLAEAEARWLDQFAALRGPDQIEAAQALGLLLGLPFNDSPQLAALRHDPLQVKGRAYVVSRELLAAMRAAMPVVLLLEDAQWIDPSSWDYLVNLLLEDAPAQQHGVLVVATARSEWNPPAALLKHSGYQPITLQPLPAEVCRRLTLALLQRVANVPESAVRAVVQRSEGVPYYVEEIINWFFDQHIIDTGHEPWQFDMTRFHEAPLPATLQHLLLTRLSALTEIERTTLQYGSIFGRNWWEGGLAALGLPDCAPTLKQLQPRGFVDAQPESSLAGEKEWSFHHNLLQAVAYESVLKRIRRELHKTAAQWLEEQARQARRLDEFVGILAEHLDRAGDSAAAGWYLRAGLRAQGQGAYREARLAFERVLDLVPADDHARRWQAWLGRNDAVSHLGDRAAYQESVEALLNLARHLTPLQRAETYYRQALLLDAAGDYPAAFAAYQHAVVNAREDSAAALELRIMGIMLICQNRLGDAAGAAQTAQQILSRLNEVEELDAIDVLINVAVYYVESGDLARAAQLHQEQASLALRLGQRRKQATALMNLGYDFLCLGMYEAGRAALEPALQLFETFGARRELAYARLNLGLVYWRSGDLPGALKLFDTTQHELAMLGDTFAEAAGLSYSAIVLEMLNETSAAQQRYEAARTIFTQVGARGNAADALAGLARCALALDNRDSLEQLAVQLWAHLKECGTQGLEFPLWAYLTCAQAHAALGNRDQVRKIVAAGYSDLITRAERISRVEWGRSFLNNVPEHHALLELWEHITLTA
jgi:class 3 adenylate cyclase/tetratricopeptide (TPR) repeat protein